MVSLLNRVEDILNIFVFPWLLSHLYHRVFAGGFWVGGVVVDRARDALDVSPLFFESSSLSASVTLSTPQLTTAAAAFGMGP